MRTLMLQGTGSDVGKSVLVAGLCRLFANRGLVVRPFKPQNMSNNAAVTAGGEIGRAQALQAMACRTEPTTDMNPVLIKPQTDRSAQVIVEGSPWRTMDASDFQQSKALLAERVRAAFERLRDRSDLVLIEGAGSPAEVNLRAGDIANMGFARSAGVPVVLVGDIDRGGVIASLVGTKAVLDPDDAALVRGFIINKFRGDPDLFRDGYQMIAVRTGWRGLGVVPWLRAAAQLPAEDAVVIDRKKAADGRVRIAVPMLSRIANFDEFGALESEAGVALIMVPPGRPLPGDADIVILPGTKATISDLAFFRAQGWDVDLQAHVRRGGLVLGICGGYQMLGRSIADRDGIEGEPGEVAGLGYLPIRTSIEPGKTVRPVMGRLAAEEVRFSGYEIHAGRTELEADAAPLLVFDDGTVEGVAKGNVSGCYVHGLFDHPSMRAHWLGLFGAKAGGRHRSEIVDEALDAVAGELERALDVDAILAAAAGPARSTR
jgi:adenosylcobyric acid synthase